MDNQSIVKITNLVKEFKDVRAVDNLSLEINKGSLFGFLGPNGAGKSTTIRIILSLMQASSGKIELFGEELKKSDRRVFARIGALVERPDFYTYLSAIRNLEFFAKLSGADTSKKNLYKHLDMVGLAGRETHKVKTYSMGMKQRLGLAQALIHNPDLLILDEPTNGLDPMGMKEVRDLLTDLVENQGKTVFISSHILKEVEAMATHLAIIDKGKTVVQGTIEEILAKSDMKVEFRFENPGDALASLENSEWKSKLVNSIEHSILFNLDKENTANLIKYFADKNIAIHSVTPSNNLENYFIQVIGGAK